MKPTRADRFVDWFLGSDYFQNWQNEQIESGGYSRDSDRRDRFGRCHDAAEDGCDGSTHAEHIADMREAFSDWVRYGGKRNPWSAGYDRFETAVNAHFDAVEAWHEQHGSLEQEVG